MANKDKVERQVLQPEKFLKMYNVKDIDEAKRVFSIAMSFLVSLKPGEILECNNTKFEKIDHTLLYMDTKLDLKSTIDDLEKRKIIKIPI